MIMAWKQCQSKLTRIEYLSLYCFIYVLGLCLVPEHIFFLRKEEWLRYMLTKASVTNNKETLATKESPRGL